MSTDRTQALIREIVTVLDLPYPADHEADVARYQVMRDRVSSLLGALLYLATTKQVDQDAVDSAVGTMRRIAEDFPVSYRVYLTDEQPEADRG